MKENEAYVALNLLKNLGAIRIKRLVEHFGSATTVLRQSTKSLRAVKGIGIEMSTLISSWHSNVDFEAELALAKEHDCRILTFGDEDYPKVLRELYDPPAVLYIRGELRVSDWELGLAVVGSRRCTHYGLAATKKICYRLAARGICVISGMARGIDTQAHEAALEAGGRTLAFLGSGITEIYPRENAKLAKKIIKNGALLSEFPMRMPPDRRHFPMRNRLISAMGERGVLVVECALRSGALITANLAAEQGRTVFAVPGQIDRTTSQGTNRLIQEGAALVSDAQDIIDEINNEPLFTKVEKRASAFQAENSSSEQELGKVGVSIESLDEVERKLLACFDGEKHADELAQVSGFAMGELLFTLSKLEMKGFVKALPGRYFQKL